MNTKRLTLAVVSVLLVSDWVLAEGWYASVYGGHTFSEAESRGCHALSSADLKFELDLHVGGRLGYTFPERGLGNWRAEIDLSHISGELGHDGNASIPLPPARAEVDSHRLIVRGLYEFAMPTGSRWRPYIGVGVGFISVDVDTQAFEPGPLLEGIETMFAGEVSGGVSYILNEKIDLFIDMKHRIED